MAFAIARTTKVTRPRLPVLDRCGDDLGAVASERLGELDGVGSFVSSGLIGSSSTVHFCGTASSSHAACATGRERCLSWRDSVHAPVHARAAHLRHICGITDPNDPHG
jgi:hypothetical protein